MPVAEAIKNAKQLIEKAKTAPTLKMNIADSINDIKASRSSERKGAYKHLMTGVSFMIPFVVAGGILIALSFIFGIEAFKEEGTLAAASCKLEAVQHLPLWFRSCRDILHFQLQTDLVLYQAWLVVCWQALLDPVF